jgi:hypothetical protein
VIKYSDLEGQLRPPGPVYKVNVLAIHESGRTCSKEVIMILDTGSDFCCIPLAIVRQLETDLEDGLPYSAVLAEGFDGKRGNYRSYRLRLDLSGFPDEGKPDLDVEVGCREESPSGLLATVWQFVRRGIGQSTIELDASAAIGVNVDFTATSGEVGLLGRDILNRYHLCFDGPNHQWDVFEKKKASNQLNSGSHQ